MSKHSILPYRDTSTLKLKNMIDMLLYTRLALTFIDITGKDPKKMSIMDIGSGHGEDTLILSTYFNKVYGVDPSLPMLKVSRELKQKAIIDNLGDFSNVRFYQGDMANIPIKKVDVVYMKNTLHFSRNISKDLSNILKEDAYPNPANAEIGIAKV